MKRKLPRILGVVLTVVLLASFFAFAVPVSAGTLAWTGIAIPAVATNQLLLANRDVGEVAISPNFANDNTMFAAMNDIQTAIRPIVYKSTNGGHTWVPTSTALGAAVGDVIVDLEVSANYANDNTVFVAVQTPAGGAGTGLVYRSTNGGATFSQLGVVTLGAGEVITSMSVSPNYDGTGVIAIGIADVAPGTVIATAVTGVQLWGSGGVLNWTNSGPAVAQDVTAVQFSPNYPIDATLLAVTSLAAAQPVLMHNVGGVWSVAIADRNVGATPVVDFDALAAAITTNLRAADIALPSDYNGTTPTLRRAYVSIVGEAGVGATTSNVYRIDNAAGVALTTTLAVELWDIEYSGTYAAGTLFGGLYAAAAAVTANVYYSSTVMTTTPVWYAATNAPSGVSIAATTATVGAPAGMNYTSGTHVAVDANFATSNLVVAGTNGDDSAFAVSTNAGVFWNERGLIDNAGAALAFPAGSNVALSPDYANDSSIFLVSDSSSGSANDTNLWRSQDGGALWDRVYTGNFATGGVGVIAISDEYATNGVLYLGDTTTVNVFYSADRGDGWSARAVAAAIGVTIVDMAAPDATTLYVADVVGGNVAKSLNSGWVWAGANSKATGSAGNLISIAVEGDQIVVGDDAGTVFRSADANTTWARVGAQIVAGQNTYVAVQGDQLYAQLGGTGDVYRFDVGVRTAWWRATATPALGLGMYLAPDDTLYALDPTAAANTTVYRSIDPKKGPTAPVPTFEWITGLTAIAGRSISGASGSTNTVVVLEGTTPALMTYSDTLSAGSTPPTLLAPDDGAALTVTDQASYSVENATGVTNWQFAFSNDPTFTTGVDVTIRQTPPALSTFVDISADLAGVSNELPVYWMARALAGDPLVGPWSASRVVNPQPQVAVNAPALVGPAGITAVEVSTTPVFSWAAFKNATGYRLQVAIAGSEALFTQAKLVLDVTLGPTTSYYLAEPLENDSAYFWRVKALTSAGASDWSAAVGFKTEAKAVTPAPPVTITQAPPAVTPTITLPPPTTVVIEETPITPGWIYAIIIVGAVLVIAVIVLIVRTRRVA